MSVYVYSISHDLLCYMNSEFLADSFAGVYIVMLMNGSGDDECLSGHTLNIPYCVSTPF